MKLICSTCLVLITLMSVIGCASKFPEPHSALDVPSADLVMAPKDALAAAKRVVSEPPLSLGVQSENRGTIMTGYQSFPGEWHIGRRWQERTQYRITVIPDFDEPPKGVRFADVRDGTPAAKAGLKAGDILIEFDGKDIGNLYDFTYALQAHKPGDEVLVKVLRGSQSIEAKVLLTERR